MATMHDRETFGRARLSFAERGGHRRVRHAARAVRERRARRRTSGARSACVRGTYGQRQADDAQMLRIKIPQGILTARAARRARRRRASATRAASATSRRGRTSSSISSSCTTSSRRCGELADAGLTTREACGNSVRNITACPYAGVAADEAVRRHAVRRGADALPAAPSAQLVAAAQVQDRVRRLRATITSRSAINDLGWSRASDRRRTASRGFRVDGRRRHGDHGEGRQPAARVPAGDGDVRRRGSDPPRVPSRSATTSTSSATG